MLNNGCNENGTEEHENNNTVHENGVNSENRTEDKTELEDKANSPADPTYPPNSLLSPSHYPASPFDPRFMYPGRSEPDLYAAHSRQGSDPYSNPGIHSPMSPYYPYHPYIDPIRYAFVKYQLLNINPTFIVLCHAFYHDVGIIITSLSI